jgi:hypothetical protein
MYRSLFLLSFFACWAGVAPAARCADSVDVKILHVGLEGTLSRSALPTWVHVQVRNNTAAATHFDLVAFEANLDAGAQPQSEKCTIPVTLDAAESREFDIPLYLYPVTHGVLSVEVLDSHGLPHGRTGRRIPQIQEGIYIALFCATPDSCKSIQQAILFTGTPQEQTQKSQSLRILQLSEAPRVGWAYSVAQVVIVATPLASFSTPQLEALEEYVHGGGMIVLFKNNLTAGGAHSSETPKFLSEYPASAQEDKSITIGEGTLRRLASPSSNGFASLFQSPPFVNDALLGGLRSSQFNRRGSNVGTGAELGWLQTRLGTTFHFPGFLELLFWIVAYLLIVGLVNFVILRRVGHPEWAWITMPVIAVLFSVLLYAVSARNHPRNFGLDEITIYRIDNRSTLASSVSNVRVSAPERSYVDLNIPRGLLHVLQNQNRYADIPEINFSNRRTPSRDFRLSENWESRMFLRRWSFVDLEFAGNRRFAGVISRDSQGRLHNDTGINYEQAIVVDEDDVFLLDKFPAGAVVDLGHVPRRPYAQESGRQVIQARDYPPPPFPHPTIVGRAPLTEQESQRFEQEYQALQHQDFSLLELIRGWSPAGDEVFSNTKAVFFGLSTDATIDGSLSNRSPEIKKKALTVVTFEVWP